MPFEVAEKLADSLPQKRQQVRVSQQKTQQAGLEDEKIEACNHGNWRETSIGCATIQ